MITDDSGKRLDPTDGASWTDEDGRPWRRRSAVYGKRLRKLLTSAEVRVLHWNNTTGETRGVPIGGREHLRHAVDNSLTGSDLRECEPTFYAYDFKGPDHETLVIISEHRHDLPE